jgi:isopenicillin N synthase-like dioxygenase
MSYVPVIDLDRDPATVGAELDDVCANVGFFQIVGHEVDPHVADRAWDAAAQFFALPLADRLSVESPSPGYAYGYSPFSAESLAKSLGTDAPPDLKEVYNSGPVDPPTHEMLDPDEASVYVPNLWPAALPELELAWTDYHHAMLALSARLLSLFARGLSLDPGYFDRFIDHSPSALRAICYPARDAPPQPGQLRAGAHTDYGTLTMLRQDTVGGLQVLTLDDAWADVESVPGAYVVNIGDLLARWTNDRWRSTLHRVVDPGGDGPVGPRQSMPFFHNANWDAEVECLPTCVAPGERPKYEPVLAGPHLMSKFRKTVAS